VFVGFSRLFLLGILIFKGPNARRLYKSFGVEGLTTLRSLTSSVTELANKSGDHPSSISYKNKDVFVNRYFYIRWGTNPDTSDICKRLRILERETNISCPITAKSREHCISTSLHTYLKCDPSIEESLYHCTTVLAITLRVEVPAKNGVLMFLLIQQMC
jgi:hypothetical protein